MQTKTRFHKLTAWVLTLAMLMTFITSFALVASAESQPSQESPVSTYIRSTDVVIVMDISNSMNADADGNSTNSLANRKITFAKNATKTFVEQFATNTELDENRHIGIVTFNRDASVAVEMTETNDNNDYLSIANEIDEITAPADHNMRWTNIQGGLKLAANLLADSIAAYKYIILMTDGFPTTYLVMPDSTDTTDLEGYNTIMSGSYDEAKAETANDGEGEFGYFANTRTKELNTGGVSYSNRAAKKAAQTAKSIKDSGINIFSVGIALPSQDLSTMWSYIIDTTGMTVSEDYAVGNDDESYRNWLKTTIAGGDELSDSDNKYSDVGSQTELETSMAAIMGDIESTSGIIAAASVTTSDGVTTNYGTMEDALIAAQANNGSTLKLLKDYDGQKQITSGVFTIDLNGYTWSSESNTMSIVNTGTVVTLTDSDFSAL